MLSSLPLEPGPQVGGSVLVMPGGGEMEGENRKIEEKREGQRDWRSCKQG